MITIQKVLRAVQEAVFSWLGSLRARSLPLSQRFNNYRSLLIKRLSLDPWALGYILNGHDDLGPVSYSQNNFIGPISINQ
tara:strand:- start:37 stop:276 length:240 start_codon:yes stop_codon:yes gene_type:complete